MKWLILIMLTQGNPFTIDHKPFDTEDDCVAWVSDLSNVQELAMEVIAEVGFNNPVTGIYCITDQERNCLLYTSPSPRDKRQSRMPSSA